MQQNVLAAQKTVVNVRFDQVRFRNQQRVSRRTPELYDVLENEILVIAKNQRIVDNYRLPRVQSWWHEGSGTDDAAQTLNDSVKFYGIAVTPHNASLKYMLHQGFVAARAGICKAVNESDDIIHAGELLTFEANKCVCKQRGVPRDKCRFTFVRYNPTKSEHVERGIVGKALSNAKQHATFDVLLQGQETASTSWKHMVDPEDDDAEAEFDRHFRVTH